MPELGEMNAKQVAALAGVPRAAIERARGYLETLERQREAGPAVSPQAQLDLAPPPAPHPVLEELAAADPDSLTPREALALLYELKDRLAD